MSSKNPKDGFDLIEYPCDYGFKAMCRVDSSDERSATQIVCELVLKHVDQNALIGTYNNISRTGKFESVTITVRLTEKAQLEAIYGSLSEAPQVVMTL